MRSDAVQALKSEDGPQIQRKRRQFMYSHPEAATYLESDARRRAGCRIKGESGELALFALQLHDALKFISDSRDAVCDLGCFSLPLR